MADVSQSVINIAKELLQEVSVFLKDGLQRALTIKTKENQPIGKKGHFDEENKSNIFIIIEQYKFTLIEKIVIFDRRYVNFNVYSIPDDNNKKIDKENEVIKQIFKAENNEELVQAIIIILNKIDTIENKINSIRTLFKMSKMTIEKQELYIGQLSGIIKSDRKYTQLIHRLTVYASSSQVGSWRLCKTEPVNRLNKFDDYVQSTVIQWKLTRFICYWFYRPELLWADETVPQNPQTPQQQQLIVDTRNRNNIRNNRVPFVYPQTYPVTPQGGFPQNRNTPAAIPVYYVMEDRLYAYQSFPQSYNDRTEPDNNITCKIVDRGLGSIQCYNIEHPDICSNNKNCPLPAPCPFQYWNDNGKCGDNFDEVTIKGQLNKFSDILNEFYNIEQENGSMKITELYTDCMVYKNFKQDAHVFKVRLIPIPDNNLCYPNSDPAIPEPVISPNQINFYRQPVDLVFVHYTIQQWTNPNYEPNECEDVNNIPGPRKINPKFNVQGYYILTIIPTQVLNVRPPEITSCEFNAITEIGLFKNYIKAGYYICKPLDYKSQCREYSFDAAGRLTVINLEYFFTGTRYNPLWPFKTLFSYNDLDIEALSKYSEAIIYSPSRETGGLKRQLTLPPEEINNRLRIIKNNFIVEDINCNAQIVQECPCEQEDDQNKRRRNGAEGGRKKTNKNKKYYKNKLQTYKRKKCKQTKRHRKTMKKLKKRKTKKQKCKIKLN
jgi:hypothetical protein